MARAVTGELVREETPYFIADGSERLVEMIDRARHGRHGSDVVRCADRRRHHGTQARRQELQRLAADLEEANRNKTEFLTILRTNCANLLAPSAMESSCCEPRRKEPASLGIVDMDVAPISHIGIDRGSLDIARINNGKGGAEEDASETDRSSRPLSRRRRRPSGPA